MIYVVRTVSSPAAIQAPAIIDCADAQLPPTGPAIGLCIRDPLARVLRYFPPGPEVIN